MGRPVKIKKAVESTDANGNLINGVDVGFNNPTGGQYYGVVGGEDTLSNYKHPVLKVRVFIEGESERDGWIVRQKGASKYLVEDSTGERGVCVLVDEDDASLSAGEMTITAQDSGSTEFRIKRMSNRWALDFSDNRYLINFFDVAASVTKSGGDADTFAGGSATVELAQVDNYNLYG
jgi:uncharacterized protein YdeI (BOF family)